MRILVRLLAAVAILVIVAFAVSNRSDVTVSLWPLPWDAQIPLFVAVLGAGALGLVAGAAICWASRLRLWRRARASEQQAARLARQAGARPPPGPPAQTAPARFALTPRSRAAGDDA